MHLLPSDEHLRDRALARALDLAEAAAAFASPNPAVGCVLSRGSATLGEGAHRYDLWDHAEISAIKAATAAGHTLQGATAFVTLEPCSHHGRTGPCADALIAAGIASCVVATTDPNPLVSGQGIAKLRAAGVSVQVLEPAHALAQRARRLNDAFAFSIQHGRPFVTLKTALSEDGRIAPDPHRRQEARPFWLSGTAAREDVQRLRHAADAILTGIGTVLADNPSLTDRTGLPRRRPLLRVVLDASLRTPLKSVLVESAAGQGDLLLLAATDAPEAAETALRARGAEVLRLPAREGRVDLNQALAALGARSIRSVLVEGGATLNGALLGQELADKLVLYTAPVRLGDNAVPFAAQGPLPADLLPRLSGREEQRFLNGEAEDVRTTGYLHDPWAAGSPLHPASPASHL